uniref:Centrosomal protein 152 n=1 Tax=Labrus bergylta TaxID=56723 RepID=A0A3Q3MEN8_9LABR
MSIDFDSAALQTQHEEEEYDQEDYAREQELQKLLTDLPDDMLEDSIDSSSPELQYSDDYNYGDGAVQVNGHLGQIQSQPHTWNQHSEDHRFTQGDYTYTSMGTEQSTETNDFSTDVYGSKPYTQGTNNAAVYHEEEGQRDHNNAGNHFQVSGNVRSAAGDRVVEEYKASYNPQHPAHQPKMFNSQAAHQQGQLDHLQRDFLDSTQQTADREQLAQLQILHKAQQRQVEDLERKLEDSRRNMRYIEHQFAIAKDEKDGLAVSLKESSQLVEEAKQREVQMQNKLKAMEQQVQVLNERDQENTKKQRVAEAAVDSMKQQMLELCRSDTLSRTREQHDRDLAVLKEQHNSVLLTLQQELDSTSQALNDQIDVSQRFQEQVRQLERRREEEQLERARVVNGLTQRLEESQQQCAKLLQTSSVQELTQVQIKLQQAQSAKALSENMNKVLQDLSDLKEQITLYESAVKHGVIAFDVSSDWENQLSESCMDLGLKKTNRKNGTLHSTALAHLSDSKLPKDEALRLLRVEMQRCLGSLKGKRQKISQMQEELQLCQDRVSVLQTQLDEAKLSSSVSTSIDSTTHKLYLCHLSKLKVLEKKNKELKQSEEKVRSANVELCTKMREMIQELDQEKQEAAERTERIHQQYRDDVVNRIRTELMLEHDAQIERLTSHHEQQVQQIQTKLSEANDKMLAVQECYISVCKEKDMLEESVRKREREETAYKEELQKRLEEARRKRDRETTEAACQTDHNESSSVTITVVEMDSRLSAQKQQLQLEADKVKRKAVEEARKQVQRELHEKHLEDMAKQVEGTITRAYNRWIEDLTSLPEYKAALQTEREEWEALQEKHIEQQISRALKEAEEQWHKKHRDQLEEQSSGTQKMEELREEVAALQSQLELVRREQAALLKAELAGTRAVWNRDKQQEIAVIQARTEQVYQNKLQEQREQLEQSLQQTREEADLQKKECQHAEWEQAQRQQMRKEFIAELQTGLRSHRASSHDTITHIIQTFCTDIINRAVSQTKKEWKKISEERLSQVIKETHLQHEREINTIKSM